MHHATCSEELAHVEAWVGVEQFTSDTLREVMHDVDAHIRCIAFCLPVGYDMCIDACSDQISQTVMERSPCPVPLWLLHWIACAAARRVWLLRHRPIV